MRCAVDVVTRRSFSHDFKKVYGAIVMILKESEGVFDRFVNPTWMFLLFLYSKVQCICILICPFLLFGSHDRCTRLYRASCHEYRLVNSDAIFQDSGIDDIDNGKNDDPHQEARPDTALSIDGHQYVRFGVEFRIGPVRVVGVSVSQEKKVRGCGADYSFLHPVTSYFIQNTAHDTN
jgi:hypothetical protein